MFTLTLIVWSLVVAAIVSRYPKFFKKMTTYRINLDSSDSESDSESDYLVSSYPEYSDSDSESDHLDSDSEFVPDDDNTVGPESEPDEQSAARVNDKLPDYMKDFYEETVLSSEWMTLTYEQKRVKLDSDLDNYRTKAREFQNRLECATMNEDTIV